ncbi:hypothetical protein GJAV_G00072220 [Gymnothorax javanicus]|nr:hypothetical protein GJAV_G00072220 [Gymnothorax javanicus]
MSKMPAKKKSCFQITSVTQAQVAASSITDDTESLDDPDESRTEDVSSEIFDVSRADFEPEVCDRSSSDETLNNVGGESEAHSVVGLHIPQDGQLPALSGPQNGGFAFRSTATAGIAHVSPHVLTGNAPPAGPPPSTVSQQPGANVTVGSSQPPASTTTTTASCSSRFRVIKLDHGTGEPFRRGRWTCTEFYDKDPEGSSVISKTVESVRPSVPLDSTPDRDSGLGTTGSSVVTPSTLLAPGPESTVEAPSLVPPPQHPVDPLPQGFGVGQQPSAGAFQPAGYVASGKPTAAPLPVSVPQPQITAAPSTLLPPGHNSAPTQKSPSMPPAPARASHSPTCLPPVRQPTEYRPPVLQQQRLAVTTAAQTLPGVSLSMGPPPVSQGPSPVMTPAPVGVQGLGLLPQVGEPVVTSYAVNQPPAQAVLPQPMTVGVGGSVASAPIPQQLPSGLAGMAPASVAVGAHAPPVGLPPPSVQNVPTTVPGSSSAPSALLNQVPIMAGHLLQGSRAGAPVSGLAFGQPPAAPSPEDPRRKSDALPQPSGISGKDVGKPLIPESLQLPAPSVNNLFGLPIPLDGDEDSASGASVVAIDNKIEQAMDLVKSHLMYAVREEVEVLKEQIKELYERNSVLERENAVLKSLANSEQLSQLSSQLATNPSSTSPQQPPTGPAPGPTSNTGPTPQESTQPLPHQPNVSSA